MKKVTLNKSLNMTSRNINTFSLNGSGEKVYANSQNMIHFKLDLSEYKYASLYKIKLRFKQSNSTNAEATLAESTEYGMHSSNARDVKSVVEGATYYREVDVTSFYTDENLVKYFAILCKSSELGLYTDSSSHSPDVIIEYISDEESTINQKYVEGTAGRALNYVVNVRSGRPTYTKLLLENETTVIPIILGLFHDPLNKDVSKLLMPKGWNFSYNQIVYRDFLDYKYIDGRGLLHNFEMATNAAGGSNVYFDSSGSGLILKVTEDEFIIDDGYNNYLHFNIIGSNSRLIDLNQEGYLSKVRREFGNHTFELIFERGTSNELKAVHERIKENDTVLENNNNLITILYNSNNTITLQATDYPTVTLTKDGSGYLTSVKEEDERLSTYTYLSGMIKTASSDNGEVTSFTYDKVNRVKMVTDYVTNSENIVNKLTFQYGNFNTFITNNFGVKIGYVFDEEGILIGEFEDSGSKYQKSRYIEKNDESVKSDATQSELYIAYEDMEITGSEGVKDAVSVEGALETNLTEHYKLSFMYFLDRNNTDFDKKSYVRVYQGDDVVGEKELNLRRFEDTLCSFSFRFIKTAPIKVTVVHDNNNSSVLTIKNIFMTKITPKECYLCTNKKFDVETQFDLDEQSFYPLGKTTFKYNGNKTVEGAMYYEDLVENQKNMALATSTYNIWYNKKRGLVVNVSNVTLEQGDTSVGIDILKCGLVTLENNQIHFEYTDYENDDSNTNYLCTKHNSIKIQDKVYKLYSEYINKNYQTVKSKATKYVLASESTNTNNSRIEIKGKEYMLETIETNCSYDQYGNKVSENICNSVDSKHILLEYEYDKMRLLSETSYIDGQKTIIAYTTEVNTGRIKNIKYPDNSEDEITYYPNTISKFKSISQTVNTTINSNELKYDLDKVVNYIGKNSGFTLGYDKYNEVSKFKNSNNTIWSIDRTIDNTGISQKVWYGNTGSFFIKDKYDEYGNLILRQESKNNSTYIDTLKYFYSDLEANKITATSPSDASLCKSVSSKLRKIEDGYSQNIKEFYYGDNSNLIKVTNTDALHSPSKIEYSYDLANRLITKNYDDGTRREEVNYFCDFGDIVDGYSSMVKYISGSTYKLVNSNVKYERDNLDRLSKEIITIGSNIITREYIYLDVDNKATNLIQSIKLFRNGIEVDNLNYEYDKMGRITSVTNDDKSINKTYEYDSLGRLIKENNSELNNNISIMYDNNGNITGKVVDEYSNGVLKKTNTYMFSYLSGYSDLLEKYDGQSVKISDTGNITNIGSTTYSWEKEKLLSSVYKSSYNYSNYYYDGNGRRIKKEVCNNGINETHRYVSDGTRILKEEIISNNSSKMLNYIYLGNQIFGFTYQNKYYFFQKNLQGDIISIYDETNTLVAAYEYDAWGNHTITLDTNSIGTINPFRYRGYYYDRESNLYYCNARYYNPEISRWMSLDSLEYIDESKINGCNLYAYCGNDPINNFDPSGHSIILIGLIIGAVVGAAVGFGAAAYVDYKDDGEIFNGSVAWYDYLGATVLGAGVGAALGAGIGYIAPQIASAISSFSSMSFSMSVPTFGWVNAGGALAFGITGTTTLTVTGAQIITGVTVGLIYMFSKEVVKENGVSIYHNYPNDHGKPAHVHVSSDNKAPTRVGPNGYPLNGNRAMTDQESKVFWKNKQTIRKVIKNAQKFLRKLYK